MQSLYSMYNLLGEGSTVEFPARTPGRKTLSTRQEDVLWDLFLGENLGVLLYPLVCYPHPIIAETI